MMVSVLAVGMWFSFELLRPEDWLWLAAGALMFLLCFEDRKSLVIGARHDSGQRVRRRNLAGSKRTQQSSYFCGGKAQRDMADEAALPSGAGRPGPTWRLLTR
jgi:hypothetical protein